MLRKLNLSLARLFRTSGDDYGIQNKVLITGENETVVTNGHALVVVKGYKPEDVEPKDDKPKASPIRVERSVFNGAAEPEPETAEDSAEAEVTEPPRRDLVVSADDALEAADAVKFSSHFAGPEMNAIRVEVDNGNVTFSQPLGKVKATVKVIDHDFPNWRGVMPKPTDEPMFVVSFNASDLRDLLGAFLSGDAWVGGGGGKKGGSRDKAQSSVDMFLFPNDKPIVLSRHQDLGDGLCALLMPFRAAEGKAKRRPPNYSGVQGPTNEEAVKEPEPEPEEGDELTTDQITVFDAVEALVTQPDHPSIVLVEELVMWLENGDVSPEEAERGMWDVDYVESVLLELEDLDRVESRHEVLNPLSEAVRVWTVVPS